MTPVAKPARHAWAVVFLLCIALCVNFFLRGNLAVAAPVLMPEFGLSQWQLGIVLSAFFWTYSIALIGSGWLVDRVDVRWVYAVGFVVWALSTISTALVASFAGLLAARMVLGVGESVAYPANSRILATAFGENRRGLANALTDVGGRVGPLVGTACGALLITKAGWRGLFIITGCAALLWLIPWFLWAPRTASRAAAKTQTATVKQLLGRRDVWGTFGGLFGANYFWYFLLSYLPSYLVHERHFSMKLVAVWGSMPYLFMVISSIGGGFFADRWIMQGRSPVRVRRGFTSSGLAMAAVLLPLTLLPRVEWALAGLFITCFAFGSYVSNLWALTQTLAGPHAAGRWTGMQNACGNVAGILSPMITGWLVNRTGHYSFAFLGASLACLGGAASFRFLIRDPKERPETASLA